MKVLRRIKMNNATWEKFKQWSDNPMFVKGTYQPYYGVEVEIDNDLPDGIEMEYADVPDATELLTKFRLFLGRNRDEQAD